MLRRAERYVCVRYALGGGGCQVGKLESGVGVGTVVTELSQAFFVSEGASMNGT